MRKRILTIVFALFVFSIPLYSVVNGLSLTTSPARGKILC